MVDDSMDVDQPKGDRRIHLEDLYDSECQNKYVDSIPKEVNNGFIITESPNLDCTAEVKKTRTDAGFDNIVEPSAMCLSKMRADEDIKVQFFDAVNLLEHEPSASQEHQMETDGNDIKDICIDEGLPVKEKIHVEDIVKDPKQMADDIYYPIKDEEFGSKNEKLDAVQPISVGLKSSTDVAYEKDFNSCESKVPIHQSGLENTGKRLVLKDLLEEKVVEELSMQNTDADDLQLKTSMEDGCKAELEVERKDALTGSEIVTGKLKSSSPTSEETALAYEELHKSSQPAEVNNKDLKIASTLNHPQLPESAHIPRRLDPFILDSENSTASAPLQRDHFESSFASVGHYAGSITYSGPIAHSGSLSHRSDASTASTRSFAFPVLKNEWNFSPVRMQKADRRRLRRQRGWMNGLFCCKF